ncbi:uncharacterized protein LOC136037971 [Artemia franciscana]|uniref:uncharacterized protein LOC136037971 n=1 Tax=Artemia franciscana TaxID=6661 RepID=UPI0032DAE808
MQPHVFVIVMQIYTLNWYAVALSSLLMQMNIKFRFRIQFRDSRGYIIEDNALRRRQVLSSLFLEPLLNFVLSEIPLSFKRVVPWVIFNVCRSLNEENARFVAPLQKSHIRVMLPALEFLIQSNDSSMKSCRWTKSITRPSPVGFWISEVETNDLSRRQEESVKRRLRFH